MSWYLPIAVPISKLDAINQINTAETINFTKRNKYPSYQKVLDLLSNDSDVYAEYGDTVSHVVSYSMLSMRQT